MKHRFVWLLASLLATPLLAAEAAGAAGVAGIEEGALARAIRSRDHAAVRSLLQQKADVNARSADGTSPLHLAVLHDDRDTVDALLRAGADAQAVNRYGVSPLLVACTNGNAALIERLLDAGADPNSVLPEGETALMTAARTGKVEAIRALIARGANVNAKEPLRGQTALMWAAAENNGPAVTALVRAGAEVSARSNGGFTPLLFAVRAGRMDSVRALLEAGANANDSIQTANRPAPRPTAAAPAPVPPSPAAARPTGASASAPSQAQQGAAGEDPQLAALVAVFNTGIRGRPGGAGTSALALAVLNAHFELAGYLVDQGADPNATEQGWTALHQIAWTRKPPIQHGLPPAVATGRLDSLGLARKLLSKGADPNPRQTREPGDGARNILNRVGSTPLLQAAKLGDVAYMRLLLEHGADPSIKTEEGATVLMAAAGVGIWHVGESAGTNEEAFEAVKLAQELGNDVNAVDVNGDTALHGAAHRGATEIVRFLVSKGAKMDVTNRIGWTPWLIADGVFYPNTYNRHPETAALLLSLGANTTIGKRRPVDLPPSEEQAVASGGASAR